MVPALAPAALFGLIIGSFLNVVAWRLPRGESLVSPGSHCPGCDTPVRAIDNIPVVSWLALRGRCRGCGDRISSRYPLVELTTAALYAAVVAGLWGNLEQIAFGVVLVTFLVPIALIDLDHRKIPNKLTAPAAVAAVALGIAVDPSFVPEQLIAGLGAGGFFFLAAVAYPRGMGMGDVKLAAVLGLFLGRAVVPALFIALMAGVFLGAYLIARRGAAGRKVAVPFGPFLALGGVVALFAGNDLMNAYLDRF
jgi:leader peptidase (prepilin peptidase)/N-methyltransferase